MGLPMYAHRELLSLQRPIFNNVEALYRAEGGEQSPEMDFGVHWCLSESGAVARHQFRVSHVIEAGVVYAIALTFTPVVVLLARGVTLDAAEFALQGWADKNRPTLGWACSQLAEWNPNDGTEPPVFESDVSPLTTTNDGRVTVSPSDSGEWAITIDGTPTWRTRTRLLADGFIAGWDARDDRGG